VTCQKRIRQASETRLDSSATNTTVAKYNGQAFCVALQHRFVYEFQSFVGRHFSLNINCINCTVFFSCLLEDKNMSSLLFNFLSTTNWLQREEGQDIIEYVLILALISIVAVVAIGLTGDAILATWNAAQAAVTGALGGG
jgi:Flp pilus assembly pilin Flp